MGLSPGEEASLPGWSCQDQAPEGKGRAGLQPWSAHWPLSGSALGALLALEGALEVICFRPASLQGLESSQTHQATHPAKFLSSTLRGLV